MKSYRYRRMMRGACLLLLCTIIVGAGCSRKENDASGHTSVTATNASGRFSPRTRTRTETAPQYAQVGDEITRQVADYMLLLEGTNVIHDMLGTTNQLIALTEDHVRHLRMAAYAADRAREYTQCVALLSVLLRCTNLPSYVGSSVNDLMAQALQNVCGMDAAVPYYEAVLKYWQHLSTPDAGDQSDALTAANNLAQAAFMRGDTNAGMTYSALMYDIADKSTLASSVRDTYKLNHIRNMYRKQGRAAAETLINNTVFDNDASRKLAQDMLAEP